MSKLAGTALLLVACFGLSGRCQAQDSAPYAAFETVASTAKNGLEGLVVLQDGSILVTDASEHVLHRVTADGHRSVFSALPFVPQVIVLADAGYVVTGQRKEPDFSAPKAGEPRQPPNANSMGTLEAVVAMLDLRGQVTHLIDGKPGSFFNGLGRLGDAYLIADSTAATIWRFDPAAKSVTAWLTDEVLHGAEGRFPGANGLKVAGGYVYVANTSAGGIYRVKVSAAGKPGGRLAKYASVARPDDFDVDSHGNVFVPSEGHVFMITPVDQSTVLAEGCTGCDAALLADHGTQLLLVTHGFGPNAGSGRLLRLKVPR